jgi:hypothetical protein
MTTEAITHVSPTRSFLVQVAGLGAGLGALVLAHEVARRQDDPATTATTSSTVVTLVLATLAVAAVGRAVHAMVSSALSDARRVFRACHLMVCGALLYAVAGGTAGALIAGGAFGSPLPVGVTRGGIVTVGAMAVAVVCLVGAGVATPGAAERFEVERNWQRALHASSRRRTTPP